MSLDLNGVTGFTSVSSHEKRLLFDKQRPSAAANEHKLIILPVDLYTGTVRLVVYSTAVDIHGFKHSLYCPNSLLSFQTAQRKQEDDATNKHHFVV